MFFIQRAGSHTYLNKELHNFVVNPVEIFRLRWNRINIWKNYQTSAFLSSIKKTINISKLLDPEPQHGVFPDLNWWRARRLSPSSSSELLSDTADSDTCRTTKIKDYETYLMGFLWSWNGMRGGTSDFYQKCCPDYGTSSRPLTYSKDPEANRENKIKA